MEFLIFYMLWSTKMIEFREEKEKRKLLYKNVNEKCA